MQSASVDARGSCRNSGRLPTIRLRDWTERRFWRRLSKSLRGGVHGTDRTLAVVFICDGFPRRRADMRHRAGGPPRIATADLASAATRGETGRTAAAGAGRLRRRRHDLSHLSRFAELQRHGARTGIQRADAGGQAGLRKLPWSGKEHVDAGGDKAKIINLKSLSPDHASQTCTTCHNRATHALWDGSQHDQRQDWLPDVPQRAHAEGRTAAQGEDRDRAVRHVSSADRHTSSTASIICRYAKARCPARRATTSTDRPTCKLLKTGTTIDESCTSCHAEKRGPVPVGARAGRRELHDLPRTARVEQRADAGRQAAVPLPALPRDLAPSADGVRRASSFRTRVTRTRSSARSCVVCHQQIHGSNAPSGKALLR